MRFMIMVKTTTPSDSGVMPPKAIMASMGEYHQQLAQAGVLLDGSGLHPADQGWRVRYGAGGQRTVTHGPFAETQALLAGYTLIQVRSREEALEWTRRFPSPMGEGAQAEIEVRQLCELGDWDPTNIKP